VPFGNNIVGSFDVQREDGRIVDDFHKHYKWWKGCIVYETMS